MSIKLDLTLDEINGVLTALGNLPFVQVEPLIGKIREQAIPQAQEQSQKIQAEQPASDAPTE